MNIDDAKSYLTNAISYWEIRRIIYNAVLGAIVIGYFVANFKTSLQLITPDAIFALFILAVLANIAYCAAYLVDIVAQRMLGADKEGEVNSILASIPTQL